MKRRVVITGLAAVSPLGNTAGETWEALCAGRSGIGLITKFDTSAHETRIAGETKAFDPLAFVSRKDVRRYDAFTLYAIAAADMALADAGIVVDASRADRIATIIGSAIGGLATMEEARDTVVADGPRRLSPFAIPAVLANLAAGQVSIRFGLKGPIACPVAACAAGTYGVGEAFRIIERGDADLAVAGGTEAAITPVAVAGFNAMRALSRRNDAPEKASRPFDEGRDGFVMAEGCGLVVLEELQSARDRGARIYAEVVGYGCTSDAYHVAAPPPGHEGAARCMIAALKDAGLGPEAVDYINAHGTSTPPNDLFETQAIRTVFGEHAPQLAVSSTKSMTGHMLGAAGGIEAVICARAIADGIIPPTINLDAPDPEIPALNFVPHTAIQRKIRVALSNSFGFGGANAVLAFKAYEE